MRPALIAARRLSARVVGWLFVAVVVVALFVILGPAYVLGFVGRGIASASSQGWGAWVKFERSL